MISTPYRQQPERAPVVSDNQRKKWDTSTILPVTKVEFYSPLTKPRFLGRFLSFCSLGTDDSETCIIDRTSGLSPLSAVLLVVFCYNDGSLDRRMPLGVCCPTCRYSHLSSSSRHGWVFPSDCQIRAVATHLDRVIKELPVLIILNPDSDRPPGIPSCLKLWVILSCCGWTWRWAQSSILRISGSFGLLLCLWGLWVFSSYLIDMIGCSNWFSCRSFCVCLF